MFSEQAKPLDKPSEVVIEARGIQKEFRTYAAPHHRLSQMLLAASAHVCPEPWGTRLRHRADSRYNSFLALRDVSFTVGKGESIGIIGRNGSGKSTLLQILCGTLTPTGGVISTHGRVAALLELGAGFNPDYSGRENVRLNGELLGLSGDEVADKMADIEAFAEIGDFIDQPARTYSSGMYMRLAFAIAAHTSPDILVVDEALAVGDIRFQIKCIEKMQALKNAGATILFVSHSPDQVKRFCDRAIWLNQGELILDGSSAEVCDKYRDFMMKNDSSVKPGGAASDSPANSGNATTPKTRPTAASPAQILSIELNKDSLQPHENLEVTINYQVNDASAPDLLVGVAIYTSARQYIFGPNTYLEEVSIPSGAGQHSVVYKIASLPLLPGSFEIDTGLFTQKGLVALDYLTNAAKFEVQSDYVSEGLVYIEHTWEVRQ